MSSRLTFAHLSDIHFIRGFSGESAFDLDDKVRKAVLLDAEVLHDKGVDAVTGVLITGDIAFAAQAEEYETAIAWLSEFTGKLKCPAEYVWCVPGNHDVDQSIMKEQTAILALHDQLRKSDRLDDHLRQHLENSNTGPLLFAPFKTFNEKFAARFKCLTLPKKPWWEFDFTLNDRSTLRLRGLNSSLVSDWDDDFDNAKVLLGSAQTEYGHETGVEYLTLCHHPVDWLVDRENSQQALLAYSRINLFGHKHVQTVNQLEQSLWLTAGAVHPVRKEKPWIPRYNYFSIGVDGEGSERYLVVEVYARVWDQDERMFVREQGNYDGLAKRYRLKLKPWKATEAILPSAEGKPAMQGESNTQSTSLREKKLMYRFIALPHHTRIAIMKKFDLTAPDDLKLPDVELFTLCFERARKKGVLDAVWDAIEAHLSTP